MGFRPLIGNFSERFGNGFRPLIGIFRSVGNGSSPIGDLSVSGKGFRPPNRHFFGVSEMGFRPPIRHSEMSEMDFINLNKIWMYENIL